MTKGNPKTLKRVGENQKPRGNETLHFIQSLEIKSGCRNHALKSKGGETLPLGFGFRHKNNQNIQTMEENEKKKRGGARRGAGRKKLEGREHAITLRLSHAAKRNLEAYAEAHGISQQEAANRILEALSLKGA